MREEYWGKPGERKGKAEEDKDEVAAGDEEGKPCGRASEKAQTNGVTAEEGPDDKVEVRDSEAGSSEL